MNCPDCGHDRTRVVDTGTINDGSSVRRRRECQRCTFRFTTYERPEWDTLQVKKRDETIEPYDREKLRAGIERALEKRTGSGNARSVTDDTITELIDEVEAELTDRRTRIVSSGVIGDEVSTRLRDLDTIAYLRFVSVYKAFSEPEEFLTELDSVLDGEIADSHPGVSDDTATDPDDSVDAEDNITDPDNNADTEDNAADAAETTTGPDDSPTDTTETTTDSDEHL